MTADKIRNIANSSKHQAWTVYCQVLDGKWVHGTKTTKEPSSFGDTMAEQMEQVTHFFSLAQHELEEEKVSVAHNDTWTCVD
eukprot:3865324-Heterocapsa_arctica.AAC.1